MANSDFMSYGGRPLVRSGDTVIYGAPWEQYYCKLKLLNITSKGSYASADEVQLAILDTTATDKAKRIAVRKKCEDLGSAILFAANWLDAHAK